MGAFEDNIRSKFKSAEVPLGSGSWDAFEHKLDGAQMSDLLFTQKVVNALEFSLVPYSPEHWKAMHQKLDLDVEGNFESDIRSKFSEANFAGPVVGWEDMLSKLDVVDVADFEESIKEKINTGEVEYNKKDWKAMRKMLDDDKNPVLWAYLLVGALALGAAAMWGLSENEINNVAEKRSSGSVEMLSTENGVELQNQDDVNLSPEHLTVGSELISTAISNVSKRSQSDATLNHESETKRKLRQRLERKFRNKQGVLLAKNAIKKKEIASANKNGKIGGDARSVQKITGSRSGGGKNSLGGSSEEIASDANESTQDELFAVAEMNQEKVALSEPYLDYQFTDVQYEQLKVRKSVLHVGLLPLLNFWENAAATGLSGKNQVSLFSSQNWKVYKRYGKQVDFEFNLPFQQLAGYEHKFDKSGFAIGCYMGSKWQDNWIYSTVNATGSYEKELSNSVLRFGAGISYKRNQLQTEGLTLIDQVSASTTVNETSLDDLKVPAEKYLTTNAGVLLANENFMFAYNVSNPIIVRINYNNERKLSHAGIASGTVWLSGALKLSGIVKVTRDESTYFTPIISISKDNSWFVLASFEELNRYIYTLGYQFSKFRAYTSYGHVTRREVESAITDLFSQSGHVAIGLTYTR